MALTNSMTLLSLQRIIGDVRQVMESYRTSVGMGSMKLEENS